ncbi:hypothetical protein CPB84DRAFT_1751177 [Gymnopilus junonius]|uniref:Uncharacterized protein n=1 Tax=Gymnopilus junonius TaxID=109634 RepID=A0A9P5TIF8_GYMJU|nr:hypothetical protein CPB84DRAFT_1751177 [Gymnopilus junonius]
MISKGDFVLPGTRDSPTSTGVLIHAVVQAYSSMSNRRRLESHVYALWGEILSCLVGDLRGVIAAPQYKIYTSSEAGASVNPDSSGYTVPDADADETIPDFTLLGMILADRKTQQVVRDIVHDFSFRDWPTLQIAAWQPFLVFELKRMPGRHIKDISVFTHDLEELMIEAMGEAEEQAQTAFNESAWRILPTDSRISSLSPLLANGGGFGFSDPDKDLHKGGHKTALKRGAQRQSTSRHRSSKPETNTGRGKGTGSKNTSTTVHWTELHESALVEKFKPNYMDAAPSDNGTWSSFILYGTPESNQRMFLIHEKLKRMMGDLELEAATNLHEWYPSESEDELNFLGPSSGRRGRSGNFIRDRGGESHTDEVRGTTSVLVMQGRRGGGSKVTGRPSHWSPKAQAEVEPPAAAKTAPNGVVEKARLVDRRAIKQTSPASVEDARLTSNAGAEETHLVKQACFVQLLDLPPAQDKQRRLQSEASKARSG